MSQLLELPVFRNSAAGWAVACAVTLTVLVILLVLRRLALRHHQRLQQTEEIEFLESLLRVIGRTTTPFLVLLSIFMGLKALTMSLRLAELLGSMITIALFWQVGIWLSTAIAAWLEKGAGDRDRGSMGILALVARSLVWVLVVLLTMDNLGVNITALVAGLGIGGLAVALAVQNILGDLFASMSIALDKPFVIGDFLVIGETMGNVEHIGIKSTRLRSLSGEQIVISNADLLGSRVHNYGRMAQRRVVFTLNIAYETSVELLEAIPAQIREVVERQQAAQFDRCHFASFGAHSLDFEAVYRVLSADYTRYMAIQQDINLGIFRAFAAAGIEFAYPTQKLFLARASQASPA